jgi:hypothetical protein
VERAEKFDEADLAVGLGDEILKIGDELGANGSLRCEGEDEAGELRVGRLLDDGEPDAFAELDEGLAAEVEEGEQEIDGEMVVKESVAGEGC